MKTFPLISINNIKNSTGNYDKSLYLTKGFINFEEKNIFISKNNKDFSAPLMQNGKIKRNGYLLEIIFHGLNYSAKRIKLFRKNFLIDVHKSEIFICKEPLTTHVKSRIYKRRLVFFSYEKQSLNQIENYMKELKNPNSYTGKGLFAKTDNYKIKKVQKRK